jgi:hypothetical protein
VHIISTPSEARGVRVTPRLPDLRFDPTIDATHWFDGDAGRTAAWNALSVIASEGELGFIDAGRWLVARIDDQAIADETRRFIQQEAFHGTVHSRLNRALAASGLPVDAVRDFTRDLIAAVDKLGALIELDVENDEQREAPGGAGPLTVVTRDVAIGDLEAVDITLAAGEKLAILNADGFSPRTGVPGTRPLPTLSEADPQATRAETPQMLALLGLA